MTWGEIVVFGNICACIFVPGYISTRKCTGIHYMKLVKNTVITSKTYSMSGMFNILVLPILQMHVFNSHPDLQIEYNCMTLKAA